MGGSDASFLAQQINRRLSLADSLQTATRFRLAVIPFVCKALRDLGKLAFIPLHMFSTGGRYSPAISELLRFIERLKDLHTEIQVMISYPHLATTIMYDVSWRWIHYLNRCADASSSEVAEASGDRFIFSIDPILVNLEGGH